MWTNKTTANYLLELVPNFFFKIALINFVFNNPNLNLILTSSSVDFYTLNLTLSFIDFQIPSFPYHRHSIALLRNPRNESYNLFTLN